MKVPMCKLCGKAHWTYESHVTTSVSEEVRELGASVLRKSPVATTQSYEPPVVAETIPVRVKAKIVDYVPTPPPDVPTDVPTTCECGKPREGRYKSCSACRKRAYRERSK